MRATCAVEQTRWRGGASISRNTPLAGLASQLTLLNTETQVITQRRLDVDLRARALDTRVSLMKALGGGWTDGTDAVQVSQH